MHRVIMLAMALGFAMFGPMVFFEMPEWASGRPTPKAVPQPVASADAAKPAAAAEAAPKPAAPPAPAVPQLETMPTYDFADVLRFDISPGWIMQRWPRVSAGLGNLQLQGYRVPLVTGGAQNDLAGSLTYYFNANQQVQQIRFQGTTGDVRRLVQFVTTRYHLGRRVVNNPGEFVYEIPEPRGEAKSVLTIRTASVLISSQPYQRFDVALVLERPTEE
jgi:hypothetical protein